LKTLFLRAARVIDPSHAYDAVADVKLAEGRITALTPPGAIAEEPGALELRVDGLWLMPGFCDPHVHLRDPGWPQKETIVDGLRAAAAGGFTAVAAMANTRPVNDSPEVTRYMLERAKEAGGPKLYPVSAVSRGLEGKEAVDFAAMAAAGVRMFSDDGMPIDDPRLFVRALDEARAVGLALSLHEEDRALSFGRGVNQGEAALRLGLNGAPPSAESQRLARDLSLARGHEGWLHVAHVSTAESLALIRDARQRGISVTCEVTPHHFSLDESEVLRWGSYAKMSPPLRASGDVEALLTGLVDGTIDMIATDHAPHDDVSKELSSFDAPPGQRALAQPLAELQVAAFERAANGVTGLETAVGLAMALFHRGLITPARLVDLMALNPARLLGLEPGGIRVGAPADITVIDPERSWRVDADRMLSRSRNTPFAGRVLKGKVVLTIVSGEIVFDGRQEVAQ
jgi:dihydroorotase